MDIPVGWRSRAKWELWWAEHGVALNRLAVIDPEKWGKIACVIEQFQTGKPASACSSAPPDRFPEIATW